MMNIEHELFLLQDTGYAAFQGNLTPGISKESVIGVRVPVLRDFAKKVKKDEACEQFLETLPHKYYDENMLHAVLLSAEKDYDTCVRKVDVFLPYVDNWAVCDCLSPKVFKTHKKELMEKIVLWSASSHTYTCRFGMEMLMRHFLEDDFKAEYLEIPAAVRSQEYYVQMMIAWFFATALAKQWDATLPYLVQSRLDTWVHNKTIQKARESFRISTQKKEYLNSLKR